MLFHFSLRQKILLCVGIALIVLPFTIDRIDDLWRESPATESVVWNRLTIVVDSNFRISTMNETTLVARSNHDRNARLTVFRRDKNDMSPQDLVRDLCSRDSCVYLPLDNLERNGAIADYRTGVPLQIVLMHPGARGIWLEYKGPADDLQTFEPLINSVVAQLRG